MSNYYDMRDAKVRIAEELSQRGWKIYGFKNDESDMMTDYYSPADWDGIATKNGFVLVIDSGKWNNNSEREITKYNPKGNLSFEDREKISKLEALRDNTAATIGEKENAQSMINKISAKISNESSYIVIDKYPKYQQNPGSSKWHIEKDDKIYDKGTGITKYSDVPASYIFDINKMKFKDSYKEVWTNNDEQGQRIYTDRRLTEKEEKAVKSLKDLILKWERIVDGLNTMGDGTKETEQAGQDQKQNKGFEKVTVTEYKAENKAVEIKYNGEIKEGMYFITKVPFTGGIHKGVVFKITEVHKNPYNDKLYISAHRLNRKLTKVLAGTNNPSFYSEYEKFDKWFTKESISLVNIEEVKTPYEVVKWVKIKDNKQAKKQTTKENAINNEDVPVNSNLNNAMDKWLKERKELENKFTEDEILTAESIVDTSTKIIEDNDLKDNWHNSNLHKQELKKYIDGKNVTDRVIEYMEIVCKTLSEILKELIEDNIKEQSQPEKLEDENIKIYIESGYVCIKFKNRILNQEILSRLRQYKKFKWKSYEKVWKAWNDDNNKNLSFAKTFLNGNSEPDPTPDKPTKKAKSTYNKEKILSKINNSIESLNKQLTALSGDYKVNTYKRVQEEKSRGMKRDSLRWDISLLNYIKEKVLNENSTNLELSLINKAFRDMMHSYYVWKYSRRTSEIKYPTIDNSLDIVGWYNKGQQQKINGLKTHNINNLEELNIIVDEYQSIYNSVNSPIDYKAQKIKEMELDLKMRQKDNIHFTPKQIIDSMIEAARINENDSILEPSAGIGNIIDSIKSITNNIECCEVNYQFKELLKLKDYKIVENDFLELTNKSYSKILMNPPFSNNQDIQHLKHAYNLLDDNGVMVCLTSNHWSFANDKESVDFRNWIKDKTHYIKDFEPGLFERTSILVKMIVIEK